jgi:hypothetical protein
MLATALVGSPGSRTSSARTQVHTAGSAAAAAAACSPNFPAAGVAGLLLGVAGFFAAGGVAGLALSRCTHE